MRDSNGKTREASVTKSFANFIDTNGTVVQTLIVNEITKLYNSLSSDKKEKWTESEREVKKKWKFHFVHKSPTTVNLNVLISIKYIKKINFCVFFKSKLEDRNYKSL